MRTQHLLLLSSIALTTQTLAAETKQPANSSGKPGPEAVAKAAAGKGAASADDSMQTRATPKNRVRYTFPPASKAL